MKKYPHIKEVIRKSMDRILAREKELGRVLTIEELQHASPSHSVGAEAALKAMKRGPSGGVFWCNVHQREATEFGEDGRHRCDPKLGGIMMPCKVVFAEMEVRR